MSCLDSLGARQLQRTVKTKLLRRRNEAELTPISDSPKKHRTAVSIWLIYSGGRRYRSKS
jgi:hypothetical protein